MDFFLVNLHSPCILGLFRAHSLSLAARATAFQQDHLTNHDICVY